MVQPCAQNAWDGALSTLKGRLEYDLFIPPKSAFLNGLTKRKKDNKINFSGFPKYDYNIAAPELHMILTKLSLKPVSDLESRREWQSEHLAPNPAEKLATECSAFRISIPSTRNY